jgi:hypothetical protein
MTARTPDREVRPGITVRDAEDAIAASLAGKNWRRGVPEGVV